MSLLAQFSEILRRDEPLAPYTWLKVGGLAQYFLTPRNEEELIEVLRACHAADVSVHILGGGSNLLIRDDGVSGAVIRLTEPAWGHVTVQGSRIRAGAGALLSHVVAEAVRAGLAGCEMLAGIPGTLGGAICGNAGGRQGEIGELVESVDVLAMDGTRKSFSSDDLSFAYRESQLGPHVLVAATLRLTPEDGEALTDRLRQIWISKKASQPLSSQSAGCIFKNPRGHRAGSLIEQAGLKGTRVGGAEVSDRHANFVVTHEGVTSADVLRLIDLVKSKVAEQFGVALELEIRVW